MSTLKPDPFPRRVLVRRDKNAVTFFSQKDGTKLRLGIGPYTKAAKPELVDIKITDWCDMGCAFCYQDSTLLGKHATWENLQWVAYQLGKAKVFEVALGGGETTGHPHFLRLLQEYRTMGIMPNFTTKKPAAVRNLWPEMANLIGGFAYSAETAAQVRGASKMFKDIDPSKVNLHYVMGLGDQAHFEEYLREASYHNYRVTLLGYKTSGRGKEVIPHPYHWWMESVSKLVDAGECPSLSIDTPLAGQYQGQMPVAEYQYHTQEGMVSLYIDNVSMEMGASSFSEKEALQPFTEDWLKIYRKKNFIEQC